MAFPEMQPAIALLRRAFLELFPILEGLERFGFKEIRVRDEQTLYGLREMFPNARFVFLFRDPKTQWPSVQTMQWAETSTLDMFLAVYERLARIYMEFGGVFMENSALYHRERVRALVTELELPDVDDRLIGDGVFARKNKQHLSEADDRKITTSEAYQLYLRLKAISL